MTQGVPARIDAVNVLQETRDGQSIRDYAAQRVVFAQGEPADAIFYLQHGTIKASVVSPHGREAVLSLFHDGAFFGEGCLSGQSVRTMTATAVCPSSVLRIERTVMMALLHDRPDFAEAFIDHLLSRNVRIEEDLTDQLFNSSEKRLARALLLMANYDKESPPAPVVRNLSQQLLADMIGTTRSRVSFFMNKFRRLGLIEYASHLDRGDVHVHHALLNVILNDELVSHGSHS